MILVTLISTVSEETNPLSKKIAIFNSNSDRQFKSFYLKSVIVPFVEYFLPSNPV